MDARCAAFEQFARLGKDPVSADSFDCSRVVAGGAELFVELGWYGSAAHVAEALCLLARCDTHQAWQDRDLNLSLTRTLDEFEVQIFL